MPPRRSSSRSRWPSSSAPCCRRRRASSSATGFPARVAAVLIVTAVGAGVDLHGRPDRLARDGMEQQAAGAGRAASKEKLHVFDRPLALWQELQSMLGGSDALASIPDAEIRLGAADAGIPVADLHRIPAVLRHPDPVHRELEGSAPRPDHEFRRPAGAAADAADPQRDRGASRQLSADGDDDQCRRRHRHRHHLRGHGHAQSGRPRRAGRDLEFHSDHRPGRDVRHPGRGRHRRLSDDRRRADGADWPSPR